MFNWTDAATQAAQMVAEGEIKYEAIAQIVGVTSRTLRNWRSDEEFAKRVEEIRDDFRQFVKQKGIAVRENRLAQYDDRWRRLQQVIEDRSLDPDLTKVPGGKTGLVVITDWKQMGGRRRDEDDEEPTFLPVYEVDTGLLREMRELEKQAAQDLGQWTQKTELTGKDGGSLSVSLEAAIAKVYGADDPAEEGEGCSSAGPA